MNHLRTKLANLDIGQVRSQLAEPDEEPETETGQTKLLSTTKNCRLITSCRDR